MLQKTITACTLALALIACSDDALQPQYDQKTPQTLPDAKTMKKHPFIVVAGNWKNNTGELVFHIDSIGNFVMRDSGNAQITEQTGSLKDVSASYNNINNLRYDLYNDKNQPMNLSFEVRQVDDKTRNLVLLNGSTSTMFYPDSD